MASRKPEDLHPDLQPIYKKFAAQAKLQGIDYILTCTYRSGEEQNELYAQGRTKAGRIVTRAKAGQSAHNFKIGNAPASKAFDIVPLEAGKAIWRASHPSWAKLGKIGMDLGLNWYGKPNAPFKEYPHFELAKV